MADEVTLVDLVTNGLADLIFALNKEGRIVLMRGGCHQLTGYAPGALKGSLFFDLMHPFDRVATKAHLAQALTGQSIPVFESYVMHKSGSLVLVQWSFNWLPEADLVVGMGRNITEQEPKTQEHLRRQAIHQVLLQHGTDMVALLDTDGRYLYLEGSTASKILGYKPEQLLGEWFMDFVHPDDQPGLQDVLPRILQSNGPVNVPEFRFRTAGGEYRWVETTATSQVQIPHINGFLVTSVDVTERVLSRQNLQESEERYKALFQNNPNMILMENAAGIILDVNPAALDNYGYTKEQALGQHFGAFINPENLTLSMEMLGKALSGEQVKFEIEETVGQKGLRTLEIMKVPVIIGQKVTAVYSICQDITEVKNSYKTIQRQAQKLNTIFESITDAFFTIDPDWTLTYINSEFDRILGTTRADMIGHNIMDFFPEADHMVFYRQYRHALETGKAVHFESFAPNLGLWLEVKAFPSEEGLSVYFSNVTENVMGRQELEKLSLVARKTINGVLFLNPDLKIEWVNEGFTNLTGYSFSEVIGWMPREFLRGPNTDKETVQRLIDCMTASLPCSEEIVAYRKNGEPFWVALEFTPVFNQEGQLVRYIIMQTDITYRKEAEEARKKMTRDLYRQNQDMQQFTYIVSHNLRAPVANALGYAQLLAVTSPQAETYPQCLENLQISIQRLDEVLKDLNLLLSIRDNKDNIGLEKVGLEAECRIALASLQESLDQAEAEVELNIPPGTVVTGNKVYLQSIFYNLISNAIKYRAPGRILKITISSEPETRGRTLITVSDNGSGFDLDKVRNQVFKLYKRFHDKGEGRGMGLFLVKTQIEAMGGQVEVNSKENGGTTFYLKLK